MQLDSEALGNDWGWFGPPLIFLSNMYFIW